MTQTHKDATWLACTGLLMAVAFTIAYFRFDEPLFLLLVGFMLGLTVSIGMMWLQRQHINKFFGQDMWEEPKK